MQSLRSKIFIWLIKNRHLFKLKLTPPVIDEKFNVNKFRREIDAVSKKMKPVKGVSVSPTKIDDMYAEWITPDDILNSEKVILYIHGGGFISGSCLTHHAHVSKFVAESKTKALLFNYRLAPEHPFPAAIKDCITAYQFLLERGYNPNDIIVGGESAGATLSLSLIHALKTKKIDLPKAVFTISPVTDLRCQAESFKYNSKKDIAPLNSWKIWTEMYIDSSDPKDPLLSPQFGNFKNFPPLYICVGTNEIHYDDCCNLAEKASESGVNVTLTKWPYMVHAFPILSPLFPEAKAALEDICDFIKVS